MRERVLITGANGFVGYHLIEEALKQNLDVYVAVREESSKEHIKHFDIKYTSPAYHDIEALRKEIKENRYDYIIHAAGTSKALSQAKYNRINADYTANLAKAASGQLKKFVFLSSLAAGGPLKTLNGIITEADRDNPLTRFGRSKLLAEQELKKVSGLKYTILRPTVIYGPHERELYRILKQIAKGIEPYAGKMQQKLSFIYVKDLAVAAVKALHLGDFNTYHIADGNFYNKYELGEITKELLGLTTLKFHLPVTFVKLIASINEKLSYLINKTPVIHADRIKELTAANWACSIEAAKQELGFYPAYNLDRGMQETINWYKHHQWL